MQTGQIKGSVWHFFQSPTTGLAGPTGPLRQALQQSETASSPAIGIVVH